MTTANIIFKAESMLKGKYSHREKKNILIEIIIIMLILDKATISNLIYNKDNFYASLRSCDVKDKKRELYFQMITSLEEKNLPINLVIELFELFISVDDDRILEKANALYSTLGLEKGRYSGSMGIACLNKLVLKIFKNFQKSKIGILFNIDCESGMFIRTAYEEKVANKYIGYGTSYEDVVIANMIAEQRNVENYNIVKENILYNLSEFCADMIYAFYPLSTKNIYRNSEIEERRKEILFSHGIINLKRKPSFNMLCLLKTLDNLSDNGMMITIIPDGGLYNLADEDIRRYFIENNYLDTIISLPMGVMPGLSSIQMSMLIFRKGKREKQIKFIDASEWYVKQRRFSELSDDNIDNIVSAYKYNKVDNHIKIISNREIQNRNYNLDLKYYDTDESIINPRKLGDVIDEIFRGYQIKAAELDRIATDNIESTEYRLITVADIQPSGYISDNLQAINITDKRKFNKYCLEEGDLIITAKNTSVKMAVYHELKGVKTVLSGNLICIRLNQTKCNPYYLQAYLVGKDGERALNSIQTGTAIKVINPKQLETMTVSLLDIEKQNNIAENYKDTILEIKKLQCECEKKIKMLKDIYTEYR